MPQLPSPAVVPGAVPPRPPAPRRPWRQWALAGLLLGLLGGGTYDYRRQRQLNRYARRTWATLTWR